MHLSLFHAIQHVLIAGRWEQFIYAWRVIMPRCLLPPKKELFSQRFGTAAWISIRPPVITVITLTEHIMQLQKLDNTLPVIVHFLVKTFRHHVHNLAGRRKVIAQDVGRLLNQG